MIAGAITYYEVDPATVPADHVKYARGVATIAGRDLDMPTPSVRWFGIGNPPAGCANVWTDDRHLIGFAALDKTNQEVWVRVERSLREVALTVGHEVHHLAWARRTGFGYRGPREVEIMEQVAEAFATALVINWRL